MRDAERSEQREQAERMLQTLEALVLASSRRTEVLETVGQATDFDEAELAVRELLGVGEIAAKAELDVQLRRFTSRERAHLTSRLDELRLHIQELE